VALVAGNRVLVKDNATGSQNGIYTAASGAWTRATDADTSAKVTAGLLVAVEEGTVNDDTIWLLSTNNTINLNTTPLAFQQVSGKEVPQTEAEARTATTLRGWTAQRIGQAIAAAITALVVQATETIKGIGEIATQAETNDGTDDLRIVTPLKLRFGFARSLTQNGYIVFPTWLAGFIIQWGIANSGVATSGTVSYNTVFNTVLYRSAKNINGNATTPSAETIEVAIYNTNSVVEFDWVGTDMSTGTLASPAEFNWLAIGY
jgi:hypothetical protein